MVGHHRHELYTGIELLHYGLAFVFPMSSTRLSNDVGEVVNEWRHPLRTVEDGMLYIPFSKSLAYESRCAEEGVWIARWNVAFDILVYL